MDGCGSNNKLLPVVVDSRTSLSIFTLVLRPSMASSFWPSRSSAKRVLAWAAVSDDDAPS
jgi:hypothetical protein